MDKNCITLDLARYSLALTSLTNEQLGLLMRYIIRYWQGENVEMNGYLKSFFELIRADIDKEKNSEEYDEKVMKLKKRKHAEYLRRKTKSSNSPGEKVNSPDSPNSPGEKVNSPDSPGEKPKNNEKEKVTQKEKEDRILFNEKEIYREKGGQTTLYPSKETEKRFQKPTVEEVADYCAERGYRDVDAEKFCAYYGSIGWKVGNHSILAVTATITSRYRTPGDWCWTSSQTM